MSFPFAPTHEQKVGDKCHYGRYLEGYSTVRNGREPHCWMVGEWNESKVQQLRKEQQPQQEKKQISFQDENFLRWEKLSWDFVLYENTSNMLFKMEIVTIHE